MAEKSAAAVQTAPSRPPVKTVKMESLMERITRLHDAIARRAYELFERDGRINGNDTQHWLEAEKEFLRPVKISVEESEKEVVVHAEVPGFAPGDLEVNVEPRCVIITGKHQTKNESKEGDSSYSEESSEEIFRSVELPTEINTAKISTSFNNGVLDIQLAKVEAKIPEPAEQKAA